MQRRTFIRGAVGVLALTGVACDPVSRAGSPSATAIDGANVAASAFTTVESSNAYLVELTDGATIAIDRAHRTVSRLTPSGEVAWTLGEDVLNGPVQALDWNGELALLDRSGRVLIVSESGEVLRSLPDGEQLSSPADAVVLDDGRLAVSDTLVHRVVALERSGSIEVIFEDSEGQGAVLNGPRGLAIDAGGDLHIVSGGNARIEVIRQSGEWLRSYGGTADGLRGPQGLAIDAAGRSLVADPIAGSVFAFESGVAVERLEILREDGFAAAPRTVQVLADGTLRVALR